MDQRRAINYQAPLCKEPGCGNHTWSGYCAHHKEKKKRELQNENPRSLSLENRSLLREFTRPETNETRAIGEEVETTLPGMFDERPTAKDMESAARAVTLSAHAASVAREFTAQLLLNAETDPDNTEVDEDRLEFDKVKALDEHTIDPQSVTDSASRHDFFGRSCSDASIVSSYLLNQSWKARISRGDDIDFEGSPVVDQSDYVKDKIGQWEMPDSKTDSPLYDDVLTGMQGRSQSVPDMINAYMERLANTHEHDRQVAESMNRSRDKFGPRRMSGYSNSPHETIEEHQRRAWGESYLPNSGPEPDFDYSQSRKEFQSQTPNSGLGGPKYITEENGYIYDENMNFVGQVDQRYMQKRNQHTNRDQGNIPSSMMSQNDPFYDRRSADDLWNAQQQRNAVQNSGENSNGKKVGRLAKGVGRGLGRAVKSGWDLGWAFHDAKREVDDRNRERLANHNQDKANQAIIREEKYRRKQRGFF